MSDLSVHTDSRSLHLQNGLSLRGIWRETHDRINQQELTISLQQEHLCMLEADVESLTLDRSRLREQCKDAALQLLTDRSKTTDLAQLLDDAICEKMALEETYRQMIGNLNILTSVNYSMLAQIKSYEMNEKRLIEQIIAYEGIIEVEKGENKELTELLWKKDELMEILENDLKNLSEQTQVMKHSNETRERQLVSIIKERDHLRDKLERAVKKLLPSERKIDSNGKLASCSDEFLNKKSILGFDRSNNSPLVREAGNVAVSSIFINAGVDPIFSLH